MMDEASGHGVRFGRTTIVAVAGDLLDQPVQALVLGGNRRGIMGAGIGMVLRTTAGADIEREVMAQGPLTLGVAVVTGAGRLADRGVEVIFHAIVSEHLGSPPAAPVVRRAVLSTLQAAETRRVRSLAIASFAPASGDSRTRTVEFAEPVVDEIVAHLRRSVSRIERIVLVERYSDDVPATMGVIARARQRSWAKSA